MRTNKVFSIFVCLLLVFPFVLVGCQNDTSSPYLPVLKESESVYPAALATGILGLDDNCLRLKPFYAFGKGALLIWPYGYYIKTQDNKICVADIDGRIVARVGDWIKVGGGEITLDVVEKYLGKPLPENYSGPYWIVSGVIKK
jgi:hypothetical protein